MEQDFPYRVVRCPHWLIGPKRYALNRILENFTFGFFSALNCLRDGHKDVLVVETWPILAAQIGVWLGKLLGAPVLYYVQDVYPEAAEDVGALSRGGWLARILLSWDAHICRSADAIVSISTTMKSLMCETRRIDPQKVFVVSNWEPLLSPDLRDPHKWRKQLEIENDRFVVLYAGTLGLVSGVDHLVQLAEELRSDTRVLLLCVGEGLLKAAMQREAGRRNLTNLVFLPFQPEADVPYMLSAADALFVCMRPGYREASFPSKVISYLRAGRPVICSAPVESMTSKTIVKYGAGLAVPAGDATASASAIRTLVNRRDLVKSMGESARACFESLFTADASLPKLVEIVMSLAENSRKKQLTT